MFGQQKPQAQGTFGSGLSQPGGFQFSTPTTNVAANPGQPAGFSFGAAASKPQTANYNQMRPLQSDSGGSGFQFSTPAATAAPTSGFTLGGAHQPSTAGTSGFTLGSTPQQPQAATTGGFSFGSGTTGTASGFKLQSTPATGTQAVFPFGSPAAATAGIKTTAAPAASTTGFSFVSAASKMPSGTSGFGLGGATTTTGTPLLSSLLGNKSTGLATTATPAAGFAFPSAASSTTAAPAGATGFTLGGSAAKTTPGLVLGGGPPANTAAPGLKLGVTASVPAASIPATKTPSGGFVLGGAGGTTIAGGLSLGKPATTTPAGLTSTTVPAVTTSATLGLGFSISRPSATTGPTVTTTTAAPTTGLTLGGFMAPTTSAPAASTGIKLGPTLTTAALTSATTSSTAGLLGRTATTSTVSTTGPVSTAAAATPQMTYKQVEDQINKWALELEEYEKTFLEQASQVNNWDRLLMENGEKITDLNSNVEAVKAEQTRLDQELDFIMSQQQELEDMLTPLEESLKNASHVSGYEQHADHEREKTYKLAADIDGQLKQMVQDLKSIIDHLNVTNSIQKEGDDPIVQIAKILNAHTNSLQWIDQNSALLQRKVDEVSRLSELRRKEQERNFRLAFE